MDIEKRLQEAVRSYWNARGKNKEKQIEGGKIDAGTRSEVTGGAQMSAMKVLVADILFDAGLKKPWLQILRARRLHNPPKISTFTASWLRSEAML